jgi:hypothetical protein
MTSLKIFASSSYLSYAIQEVFLPFMRRAKSPQALIVIEAPK